MKELEVLVSEDVFNIFKLAWLYCSENKEPVCFAHNDMKIFIVPDVNNQPIQLMDSRKVGELQVKFDKTFKRD